MAKLTLLQMTQNILSAMSSDEVNSIFDTVESQQVAETIKETYYDLFGDLYVPEHKALIKIEGLGDLTRPNYLRLPTNVVSLDWLKYKNTAAETFNNLSYYPPDLFLDKIMQNTSTSTNVQLVEDFSEVTFYVKNNATPSFYTIFDDEYLVCNSYDVSQDSTLQASKTFALGQVEPSWTMADSFIPNLDTNHFPLLLSESKSVCFINIKEIPNQKEEQRARKHRIAFQHRKWRDKAQKSFEFTNTGVNYARNR